MSLSLRAKQNLYHSLGQLLRTGVPIPGALKSLEISSSGQERRLIRRVNAGITAGKSFGDSVAALRPEMSELEIGVIAACEKSGRLEYGMTQLASYHGSLAVARESFLKQCGYPAYMLIASVFILPIKDLIVGGDVAAYLRQTVGVLILIGGCIVIVLQLISILRDVGTKSAFFDSLMRAIPMVGKIRRAFATSRFCATYEMQLDAGINVIDALTMAHRASLSGLMRAAVLKAIPEVRSGSQVGPLLAESGAFPEPMIRALLVGEQTGQLDQELARMAKDYQDEAVSRMQTLAEWTPRLIYTAVVLYIGWRIVGMIMGIYGPHGIYHELLEG